MRKKKPDGFTFFLLLLISLAIFFFLRLTYGMQKEKQPYTALISLGDLVYDQDFLKNVSKIKGVQEIWPVVEVPVTIKVNDYTKTAVFCGIDLNAFTEISSQDDFGNAPFLLLGNNSLENMKDSNGHTISKKQQEKYLKMGEELPITYALEHTIFNPTTSNEDSLSQSFYLPCKVAAILPHEDDQIYIPISQARALCSETGIPLTVTKVLLKISGKANLEKAKQYFAC